MIEYAKRELKLYKKNNGLSEAENKKLSEIVVKFMSSNLPLTVEELTNILNRLSVLKPLTPLTGDADEWQETRSGHFQNKRCSSVFKKTDGTCYDIDGAVASANGGITWFSTCEFDPKIEFPYYPPTHPEKIYIEFEDDNAPRWPLGKYEIITDKPERIQALRERKQKEYDSYYVRP